MSAPLKLSRERMLNTTARLFAERGFDSTSISDITAELGVTRPTLYSHTRSKEELMDAIYEQVFDFYRECLPRHVRPGDPPLAQICGFIDTQIEVVDKLRDQLVVVLRHFDETVKRHPGIQKWWLELDEGLAGAIEQAKAEGYLLPAVETTVLKHTIWSVLNDLPLWYNPQGRLTGRQLTGQLMLFFSAGYTGPGNHPSDSAGGSVAAK